MAESNNLRRIAPIIPILVGTFLSSAILLNSANKHPKRPNFQISPYSQVKCDGNYELAQKIRQDVVYGGKQRMSYDAFMSIAGMERKFGVEYNGYPVWIDVQNFTLSEQKLDNGQISISLTPEQAREARGKLERALRPVSSDSTGFP